MKRIYKLSGSDITSSANSVDLPGYTISKLVAISNTRDGGQEISIEAQDDELIEMQFDDQTFWMGRAGELPKILGKDAKLRGGDSSVIFVPTFISSEGTERGFLKNILIKTIGFFKPGNKVTDAVMKHSAVLVDQHLQPQPGLFYLDSNFNKIRITKPLAETDKPYLLFIHGTASSIHGSFHKMLETRQFGLWDNIVKVYEDRIIALDHYTLSVSPFENAIDILKWLPSNIKLHIISASRGGLIGEILAKYHCLNSNIGFTEASKESLIKSFGEPAITNFTNAIKNKRIEIEKFVRVACPAAGTTILSKRLDFFLNLIINGFNLIPGIQTTPVIPLLKKLLADVLSCKSNPEVLPGLYVMNPDSDFIKVLNHLDETIQSSLHVIGGNNTFQLTPQGFITVLTKLFYLQKTDWIVETKSMTRGLFRTQNIGFYFDEGPEVNHFSYFKNKDTQEAINKALSAPLDTIADGFESFDRTLPENANRGIIMGNLKPKEITGLKPVLVLIPGILGSNLSKENREIYLDIFQISRGRMKDLHADATGVVATSLIGSFYNKFSKHFSDEYDVAVFPYDWRLSIDGEADKLNEFLKSLMIKAPGKTIKIVAHSMGGVVTRQFINRYKNDTWAKIASDKQHAVIFMGSPLGGSYLIPEILVGKGKRIRQMVGLDLTSKTKDLLEIFVKYKGLFDLLPIADAPYDFSKKETWTKMKQNSEEYDWVIPSDEMLEHFKAYRKSVIEFETEIYKNNNFVYIAGKGDNTAEDFYYDEQKGEGAQLTFKATGFGDGSVTWESGIPPVLKENGRVYYTLTTHGQLANEPDLFDGIGEILRKGSTSLISQQPSLHRGDIESHDMPEELIEEQTIENLERVFMGADSSTKELENFKNLSSIKIELKCGDLKYATYPIMVGHLQSDGIMDTEGVLDKYFGNMLSKRLATGNYPGAIGESRYFINTNKKPKGAIIVGMGRTEKLSGYQLEETVKQGLIDYLCSQKGNGLNNGTVGISTLLLGCGYAGLSVETALKAIISAAHKANQLVENSGDKIWPTIDVIELIEIYEDRALQALICLEGLQIHTSLNFNFQPKLQKILGSRKRLNFENTSDWWQRISIEQGNTLLADCTEGRSSSIVFNASMGTAREEVRRLYCSKLIIESLIDEISSKNQWNDEIAKTIFELLIPNDFKLNIRNQQNLLLVVDKVTAGYPWEMLQDLSVQASPISTTVGMIRQLLTEDFRKSVNYTIENRALIIGDPITNGFLNPLPGALKEAQLVNKIMEEQGFEKTVSLQDSASTIIKKLFKTNYKIIHLAGHGIFDAQHPEKSGMVIGNKVFLSVGEIEQLSYVPEMVFINCCHLGKTDAEAEANALLRYKLAANLGTQLIQMGVKVVVAAGWAIDDMAALDFTSDFYKCMFEGYNFGDAIKTARKNCYDKYPHTTTWGAYQCYGDQFYTLVKTRTNKKHSVRKYYLVEQAEIDLENLINKIEANFSEERKKKYIEEVNSIIEGIEAAKINNSRLEELVAVFYKEIGEEEISINLFKKLFSSSSNNFSIKTYEEYSRLKVIFYQKQPNGIKELKETASEVESLCRIRKSAALYNVLGSAYKAIASKSTGKAKQDALQKSAEKYFTAYSIGKNDGGSNLIYSLSSAIIINTITESLVHEDLLNELEWALINNRELENNLSLWEILTESRYLICKLILEIGTHATTSKNSKTLISLIHEKLELVWNCGGTDKQKLEIIEHFKLLFGFFDDKKFKHLKQELNSLLEFMKGMI